ncbi:MAG: hypothetical protein ACRCS6_11515 [Turicibacter sp.]
MKYSLYIYGGFIILGLILFSPFNRPTINECMVYESREDLYEADLYLLGDDEYKVEAIGAKINFITYSPSIKQIQLGFKMKENKVKNYGDLVHFSLRDAHTLEEITPLLGMSPSSRFGTKYFRFYSERNLNLNMLDTQLELVVLDSKYQVLTRFPIVKSEDDIQLIDYDASKCRYKTID